MSTDPSPRRPERLTLLLVLGVAAVLLVLTAAGIRTWRDLASQRAREAELQRQILDTEARIESLRLRIRRLRDDPATLERLAREELGFVRPEDVVIVVPDAEEDEPPPPEETAPGDDGTADG